MNITWKISQMDRKTADGFVTTAHWICTGVDGEFTGSVYASCGFEGELSVPYEQLTEATVLGWVWQKIDKEATEAAVAAQINAQKNPVQASGLPWGN
jgi:hypothetical protein